MAKKKTRVYGKMRLFETSAVGIPAYPDATLSADSFSLIKALTNRDLNGDTNLNEEENTMSNEEVQLETADEVEETEEVEEEEEAEVEEEVEAEKSAKIEKSIKLTKSQLGEITKAITMAVKDGMSEVSTERGFVEKSTLKEDLSQKSLGELAIGMGLFKTF